MTRYVKMNLNRSVVQRLRDADDLACLLFPGNRDHQQVFLAIFLELKWARTAFHPDLNWIRDRYRLSERVFERVRAKMRNLGVLEHVSRFSPRFGFRSGWILSSRFSGSLRRLAARFDELRVATEPRDREKDFRLLLLR